MRYLDIKSLSALIILGSALASTAANAETPKGCTNMKVLPIVGAYSKDDYDRNYKPSNVIDNNLSSNSRWSSKGSGNSITLDLGSQGNIYQIQTAWYKADKRKAYFDVATSTDGNSWETVLKDATAKNSRGFITFNLSPSRARLVKIIGRGNSSSSWNSLLEVKINGCADQPPLESCSLMDNLSISRASSPNSYDAHYNPSLAIDNNLDNSSRWSSKGIEKSITLELKDQGTVRQVSTAWYKGNARKSYFDVLSSVDNKNWQTVLSRAVAEKSDGMINFDVKDSQAKFIKIVGYGNSDSLWNSILEVDLYGCGVKDDDKPNEKPDSNESIALIQSLFELEGGEDNLNPYQNDNSLIFDALKAQHVTKNGNGWRHELKMAKENRRDMHDTTESFSAQITPSLSTSSKTIALQYHGGGLGTLVKLYVSDTNESKHDDSKASNGVFDVYARLKTDQSKSETVVNFGTLRSGESFDFELVNKRGEVSVSAMGIEAKMRVSDSEGAYLKFGNYLQAQDAESGKDINSSKDWATFFKQSGITKSVITFSNIEYTQN